jgi:hypothetical protein
MVDANGGLEIQTSSEDPNQIAAYLEIYYRQKRSGIKIPRAWFAQ